MIFIILGIPKHDAIIEYTNDVRGSEIIIVTVQYSIVLNTCNVTIKHRKNHFTEGFDIWLVYLSESKYQLRL